MHRAARARPAVVDPGEGCDEGESNSDDPYASYRTSCALALALATCGDGVLDDSEACDEGAENSASIDRLHPHLILRLCEHLLRRVQTAVRSQTTGGNIASGPRRAVQEDRETDDRDATAAGSGAVRDTKKKVLVGQFKNAGREWRPEGDAEAVNVHDFPSLGDGKAAVYGIYDVGRNEGFVSIGVTKGTAEFAVHTIRKWWKRLREQHYPEARMLSSLPTAAEVTATDHASGKWSYRSSQTRPACASAWLTTHPWWASSVRIC
jgi:hypothetical protein